MQSIKEIVEHLGGPAKVAHEVGVHQVTVERWIEEGIPEKHWATVIRLAPSRITPGKLHRANEEVRAFNEASSAVEGK